MDFYLNQSPVEVILEQEETVADALKSILSWLRSENQELVSVLINGQAYSPQHQQLALSEVRRLDIETTPKTDLLHNQLTVLWDYFSLVKQALQSQNATVVADLHNEFAALRPTLIYWLQASMSPQELGAAFDAPWDFQPAFAGAVDQVLQALQRTALEAIDPAQALALTLHQLATLLPRLADLSGLLQRGQDALAMGQVTELLTLLAALNRQIGPGLQAQDQAFAWSEFSTELNPFLLEVEQALRAQDFTLLTDLLEYEISPRLQGLLSSLAGHFVLDPSPAVL